MRRGCFRTPAVAGAVAFRRQFLGTRYAQGERFEWLSFNNSAKEMGQTGTFRIQLAAEERWTGHPKAE